MRARILLLALIAAPASAAPPEPPREERLVRLRSALDYARWNERINALYDLGDEGPGALPTLVYASDDADWQVRLAAVHFMGKIGAAAAPSLAALARTEGCPRVRISALRWLTTMGPDAVTLAGSVMTPEDQRLLEENPDRYGTERMGRPLAIEVPGALMPELYHGALDPRVCASSEFSRRKRPSSPALGKAPDRDWVPLDDEVWTPPVPAKKAAPAAGAVAAAPPDAKDPSAEKTAARGTPESFPLGPPGLTRDVDAALDPAYGNTEPRRLDAATVAGVNPPPEALPPGPPGPAAPESAPPSPRYETTDARRVDATKIAQKAPLPPRESLPPGLPAAEPREAAKAGPRFEADAGTGKPAIDPIPLLIAALSAPNPRTRSRAADELGKRGDAARRALPALRKALKDPDHRVRASAVLALGNVGASLLDVVGDIKRMLRDKDEDVRFSASIALQRIEATR